MQIELHYEYNIYCFTPPHPPAAWGTSGFIRYNWSLKFVRGDKLMLASGSASSYRILLQEEQNECNTKRYKFHCTAFGNHRNRPTCHAHKTLNSRRKTLIMVIITCIRSHKFFIFIPQKTNYDNLRKPIMIIWENQLW
jgi:hypothetical protein